MKGEIAYQNFTSGLACSQAVALAFKEEIGIDAELLSDMTLGFGGGIGRQRLVCGAVSGMVMAISALCAKGKSKVELYKVIQDACADFKKEFGSLICAELLGEKPLEKPNPNAEERTPEYYKKRPCAEICRIAGEIAEKYIKTNRSR